MQPPEPPPLARRPPVRGTAGMVAAQHGLAASAGAEILNAGGNAVDAALASSLALCVLEPWMSGLGGGGFMVIAPGDGTAPSVIDFAMVAPARLDPGAYPLAAGRDHDLFGWPAVQDARNVHGPLAIAVPGQAAGLELAWQRFASLPFAELAAPAIALAEAGLPAHWHTTLRITAAARDLRRYDTASAIYLVDGLPPLPEEGQRPLGQLPQTLRRLAEAGPGDLVRGELARALAEDAADLGSPLTFDDLAGYRARLVQPLTIEHGGAPLLTAAGLSAGPTLAHALSLCQERLRPGTPDAETYLAWAYALWTAYEHRLATMGDIDDRPAPGCTTHLCVVDRHGTMVSLTQTLLSVFGARVVSPQTGILLNNGIMWFDPRPGRPNSIAPGKRPLANMCPVIATRDGRPWLALGASGGRRILPAVMQLYSMMIDAGLDLESAFHVPRIDVSGEPFVTADARLPEDVLRTLENRYRVVTALPVVHPNHFACPTAVLREAGGEVLGITDPVQPVGGCVAGS